ncbi:mechanosensitive ion channel domain-containing protein [Engelhardtia mirabilis]|uniref:Mechanosensitive channel MscK n=1 Tax=Engelhardtia mirabilis TaxID=2528011 RepID=A0A518BDU8_9BACT|nr:Mechanosensitive channel MscK precursor [Planctomycetes bacterium Pla133]QDU99480.1 Mechanosensitive channel MscK precursor [Planctomycetes bacterium Pla86]
MLTCSPDAALARRPRLLGHATSLALLLTLALGGAPTARAGSIGTAQDSPAVAPLSSASETDRAALEARLLALQNNETLGEVERTRRVDLVKSALAELDAAGEFKARGDEFARAIVELPNEIERGRAALQARANADPAAASADLPKDLEALQRIASQLGAELTGDRARVAELQRELSAVRLRPEAAATELSDARRALELLDGEVADASSPADPGGIEALELQVKLARRRARAAEVAMLDQEMLSQATRQEHIEVLLSQAELDVTELEARLARVQSRVSEMRQSAAAAASNEAQIERQQSIGKHRQIEEVAVAIAEVTQTNEQLVPKLNELRERQVDVEARLAQTERDNREIKLSLELGITRSLGTVLVELRRELTDPRSYERSADQLQADGMEQRLALFTLERELTRLGNLDRVLDQRMARPSAQELDGPAQLELRAELKRLLETKTAQLELLEGTRREYLAGLVLLESRERALFAEAQELSLLLAERLLWIPNMSPLTAGAMESLVADLSWATGGTLWKKVFDDLMGDLRGNLGGYVAAAVAIVALMSVRRRATDRIEAIADSVGHVRKDGILLTLRTALLHLAVALPQPLAIYFVGWRLASAPGVSAATSSVGDALVNTAAVALALIYTRDASRAHGLIRSHFEWSEHTGRLLRRHLVWFTPIALAATFAINLAAEQSEAEEHTALSALGLVVLSIAVAALGGALLRPSLGLGTGTRSSIVRGTRAAWLPIALVIPLGLAGMTIAGYQYAALALADRLEGTLVLIVAVLAMHAVLLRWLTISQRRLALKVAMEKRAALLEKRDTSDADAKAEFLDPVDAINVAQIKDQTQGLLRFAAGALVVIGLWFTWVDILPALNVLEEKKLWDQMVTIDGVQTAVPITLASLGLAILIVAITITAARNAPSFLEIAVLQQLPLDAGARYASRTLSLYAIVATGTVLAFNAIGVGWSSVQWLVAALSLGLGFGLQEIFANFVSGLIILLERPVRVGDTVTVSNVTGIVSRIRMRATTITDWQRRELVVPNRNFITGELINWSLSDPILRLDFVVGIAYGSDTELAHRTMTEVARAHPLVLDQPEANVFFVGFGDSTLNFQVRVFVNEPTNVGRTRIMHDLHMAIDRACREHEIEIAFPQRDVHLRLSDGVLRVQVERGEDARATLLDLDADSGTGPAAPKS